MRRGQSKGHMRGYVKRRGGQTFDQYGNRYVEDDYGGYKSFGSHNKSGVNKRGSHHSSSHSRGRGGNSNNRASVRPLGYLLKVLHGHKEDQMELMQSLEQKVGESLNADNINVTDNHLEFVVSSEAIAFKLEKLSGQLKNSEGKKMAIFKKPYFGDQSLPAEDLKKLTQLLSSFYKPAEKFLDLSNFLEKQDLPGVGLKKFFIAQKNIATAVCKVIGSHIPEMEILDLSNNGLFNMYPYSDLPSKAPNLTKLNVSFNRMSNITHMEPVKSLKLIELILDGNPMCSHYHDRSTYVKDVHRRFPHVQMLDGHAIKAAIAFDLDAQAAKTLPRFLGNVTSDAAVKSVVYAFTEQYFTVFDKEDRGSLLLDAYDANAVLSLTILFFEQSTRDNLKINKLFSSTRNLTRSLDFKIKENCFFKGKFKVLACLADFPLTEHDLHSFRIDIMLETPKLIIFVVNGVLREKGNTQVYSFSRTFCCKPYQGGLQIVNESIHFRVSTDFERKRAFTNPGPTPSSSPVVPQAESLISTTSATAPSQSLVGVNPPAATAVQPQLTAEQKQQMVEKFSAESGLNLQFTLECLTANNWDYNIAAVDFQRAKAAGDIPATAFRTP